MEPWTVGSSSGGYYRITTGVIIPGIAACTSGSGTNYRMSYIMPGIATSTSGSGTSYRSVLSYHDGCYHHRYRDVYIRERYKPQATGVLQRWEIHRMFNKVLDTRHLQPKIQGAFGFEQVRANATRPSGAKTLVRTTNGRTEFVVVGDEEEEESQERHTVLGAEQSAAIRLF